MHDYVAQSSKSSHPSSHVASSEVEPVAADVRDTESPSSRMGRCAEYSTSASSLLASGRIWSFVVSVSATVRLRVICTKSKYFTFSVSVWPSKPERAMRSTNSITV